jgi:hypothetical protein
MLRWPARLLVQVLIAVEPRGNRVAVALVRATTSRAPVRFLAGDTIGVTVSWGDRLEERHLGEQPG